MPKPKWMRFPEYRCTRKQPYPPGTPVSEREGYYIRAPNRKAALQVMHDDFPHDWEGFTCQRWKKAGQ